MSPTPPALNKQLVAIEQALYRKEDEAAKQIVEKWDTLSLDERAIARVAAKWIKTLRNTKKGGLSIETFFANYPLTSEEGLSLMSLAEAVLRIPDNGNLDQLINEKIGNRHWKAGAQSSWLTKTASLGLNLSQKVGNKPLGKPLLRQGIKQAMRFLGQHFIMGRTMAEAIKRRKKGMSHSFDMLGEAAKTMQDAERFFADYMHAIDALKKRDRHLPLLKRASVSVKLSALYPRYEWTQYNRCIPFLTKQLLSLAKAAKAAGIPLTVDAEETSRLILSLQIFQNVYTDSSLAGWPGLGLAVQAYHKATLPLIDWVVHLAKQEGKRIPVRLVKGAYWDSEIKEAQLGGLDAYPVWTRKAMTDVHYTVCAKKLLEHRPHVLPQFATHNAYTLATLLHLAPKDSDMELQCLHGMGKQLYQILKKDRPEDFYRTYAPVGNHATLLPYLVRRLLENGASASFVNQILQDNVPISTLIESPKAKLMRHATLTNEHIPLPKDLFAPKRANAKGLVLSCSEVTQSLYEALHQTEKTFPKSTPTLASAQKQQGDQLPSSNPANLDKPLGMQTLITKAATEHAMLDAHQAHNAWQHTPIEKRIAILQQAADRFEKDFHRLAALCVLEAGKTWQDAHDEVREAIDFLRYYADQAETTLKPQDLKGPTGEHNRWQAQGRGVFLCISPWNFPLAIFTGQVAAALVSGNCVLAKPATQTTSIAYAAINHLHQAGVPKAVLQGIPGSRTTIATLLTHEHLAGVMLTGSTKTAQSINQTLAARKGPIIPFIAETGGQNAMIVDSTAHLEQACDAIVQSAFQSAGQRCSALRVLFVQDSIKEELLSMIIGAMAMLSLGEPKDMGHDIGPVIDEHAHNKLLMHVETLKKAGKAPLYQCPLPNDLPKGFYFPPTVIELDHVSELTEEVFGPILHIIPFKKSALPLVIESINQTGYGLTLGVHSRLEATWHQVLKTAQVGNIYINRNMIGAVVGVQPFGGHNLSGTGPKAGGPWYLQRLCEEKTVSNNTAAIGGDTALMSLDEAKSR